MEYVAPTDSHRVVGGQRARERGASLDGIARRLEIATHEIVSSTKPIFLLISSSTRKRVHCRYQLLANRPISWRSRRFSLFFSDHGEWKMEEEEEESSYVCVFL